MSEQVEVFKNIYNVTPTANDVGFDIPILTTTATQRVVIKDVITNGFTVNGVTLDLNGFPMAQGQNLSIDGNMIIDPSSTLKLTVAKPKDGLVGGGFHGMFFCENSSGIQYIVGDGETLASLVPTQITTNGRTVDDATAAIVDGELFFFGMYSNTIHKYDTTGTLVSSTNLPSTTYTMCNDGTYIYNSYSANSQNQYYRTKMSDMTVETIQTSGSYYASKGNQGSYFLYHDGKLYSRYDGAAPWMSIIDIANNNTVTNINNSQFNVGSYSDGAAVTTTTGGVTYIIEQGTSYWTDYNIATGVLRRNGGGSSSSTEYAQGGGEIAPGIVLIFGEENDRVSIIDMNTGTGTRTTDTGTHGYTIGYDYGARFGFAAFLDNKNVDYTYGVYVSGILIED